MRGGGRRGGGAVGVVPAAAPGALLGRQRGGYGAPDGGAQGACVVRGECGRHLRRVHARGRQPARWALPVPSGHPGHVSGKYALQSLLASAHLWAGLQPCARCSRSDDPGDALGFWVVPPLPAPRAACQGTPCMSVAMPWAAIGLSSRIQAPQAHPTNAVQARFWTCARHWASRPPRSGPRRRPPVPRRHQSPRRPRRRPDARPAPLALPSPACARSSWSSLQVRMCLPPHTAG